MKSATSLTRNELNVAIGNGIKQHINGQLLKLVDEQKVQGDHQRNQGDQQRIQGLALAELRRDFKSHVDVVQPIIENFQNNAGFSKTVKKFATNIAVGAGLIAGVGVILNYVLSVYKP